MMRTQFTFYLAILCLFMSDYVYAQESMKQFSAILQEVQEEVDERNYLRLEELYSKYYYYDNPLRNIEDRDLRKKRIGDLKKEIFEKIDREKQKADLAATAINRMDSLQNILNSLKSKTYNYGNLDVLIVKNVNIPEYRSAPKYTQNNNSQEALHNEKQEEISELIELRKYKQASDSLFKFKYRTRPSSNKQEENIKRNIIARLSTHIFNRIEWEKREADRAELANNRADEIQSIIYSIRKNYFKEEQYAIGRKKVLINDKQEFDYRYGFMDQMGEIHINFEYDTIKTHTRGKETSFLEMDGFLRVEKDSIPYLLEILVPERARDYSYVQYFKDIDSETQALVLISGHSISDSIGDKRQLQVLLAHGTIKNKRSGRGNRVIRQVPASISHLENLRVLDLHNNQISHLPIDCTKLSQLERINLRNNWLTNLPSTFDRLTALKYLDLRNNRMSRVPENLCKLDQLSIRPYPNSKEFNISGNPMKEIPACYLDKFSAKEIAQFTHDCLGQRTNNFELALFLLKHLDENYSDTLKYYQKRFLNKIDMVSKTISKKKYLASKHTIDEMLALIRH